jgi:hypothetical protein
VADLLTRLLTRPLTRSVSGRSVDRFGPRTLWRPNLTDIPGLLFWFDTTDTATMTLDGVNNIQEFRPTLSSRNVADYAIRQTNAAVRPHQSIFPNGKTVITFPAAINARLENTDVYIDNSQGCSVIFAWRVTDVSTDAGIANFRPLLGSPQRFDFFIRTPNICMRFGDGGILNPRPMQVAVGNITTARDAVDHWLNGGDHMVATGGPMNAVGSTHLQYGQSAAVSPSFAGELSHLLYIEGPVSDDILRKIEGFIAWDLGMQARLVANHPWKHQAP